MTNSNFTSRIILIACAIFILVMLIIQFNKKSSFGSKSNSEETFKGSTEKYENMQPSQPSQPSQDTVQQEYKPSPIIMNKQENKKIINTGNTESAENSENNPTNILASEPKSNEDYKAIDYETTKDAPTECYPKDKLTAEDLLPRDAANSKWAEVNPAGQGDVADRNYLSAGYHIGVDTIGQSLRNPNYSLRSDPPNPKMTVGPWNQSTIEYDQGRKHFEINEC